MPRGTALPTCGPNSTDYLVPRFNHDIIQVFADFCVPSKMTNQNRINIFTNKGYRSRIIQKVASDPTARDLLVKSAIPRHRSAFTEKLVSFDPSLLDNFQEPELGIKLIETFLGWCAEEAQVPKALKTAINDRKALKRRFRKLKRSFIHDAGLAPDKARQARFLSEIPTTVVNALPVAYPPLGYWVYESSSILNHWEHRICHEKQPDERKKRLPMHALVSANLKHDVLEDESRIFRDSEGNFIGMVKRNFCPLETGVEFVDGVIKEATTYRKSIRLEDPGVLAQAGYSAGSRSATTPAFDWVKNIRSQKCAAEKGDEMNAKSSSAFAFFWNMLRTQLPGEVLEDFSDFLAEMGSLRMDGNGQLDGPEDDGLGKYTVKIGDHEFQFHNAELAPPAGVCAENYSRANHYECQPHTFGAAWTTSRSHGSDAGGHFFMCKYGIRIRAAPNTLVVWIPRDVHGTSLQDFSPTDKEPSFHQRGLAFVTGSRLLGAWKKYQEALITQEQAWDEVFGEDENTDDEKFE